MGFTQKQPLPLKKRRKRKQKEKENFEGMSGIDRLREHTEIGQLPTCMYPIKYSSLDITVLNTQITSSICKLAKLSLTTPSNRIRCSLSYFHLSTRSFSWHHFFFLGTIDDDAYTPSHLSTTMLHTLHHIEHPLYTIVFSTFNSNILQTCSFEKYNVPKEIHSIHALSNSN